MIDLSRPAASCLATPAKVSPDGYALLDHVPCGLFIIDRDMRVLFWNHHLEAASGIPRSQAIERDVTMLCPRLARPQIGARLDSIFAGGPPVIFSSQLHRYIVPCPLSDGTFAIHQTLVTPLPIGDGETFHALFAVTDVTELSRRAHEYRMMRDHAREDAAELRRTELELRRLIETDALTELSSRRHFFASLECAVARSRDDLQPLSVIMLDLDGFKQINDSFGHLVGDEVLCTSAKLIQGLCRQSDLPARFAGDEFVVLLPNTPLVGARLLADRIVSAACHLRVRGAVTPSFSAGVATLEDSDDLQGQSLIARADEALYRAKTAGKGIALN